MREDVAVYLFLGFLESGKTKFIQETLEDKRFSTKGKTLILVCEEGEEEYNPKKFAVKNCFVHTIEGKEDLTVENLTELTERYGASRIMVEYNGMWEVEDLFEAMPESWSINQMMLFVDSNTILNYNNNMRQLVFNKLQYVEMVVFNRLQPEADRMPLHKLVRAVNRRCTIIYEDVNGKTQLDEIEDPMPFDVNLPEITIEDRDYALWYADITEDNPKTYLNKTVIFKGMVANEKKMKLTKGTVLVGRHVMRCCADDIEYSGLVCKCGSQSEELKTYDWVLVNARVTMQYDSVYQQVGPVLVANSLTPCEAPDPQLAEFY